PQTESPDNVGKVSRINQRTMGRTTPQAMTRLRRWSPHHWTGAGASLRQVADVFDGRHDVHEKGGGVHFRIHATNPDHRGLARAQSGFAEHSDDRSKSLLSTCGASRSFGAVGAGALARRQ